LATQLQKAETDHLVLLQTAANHLINRLSVGFIVGLATLAMPHFGHAQSKQQHEEALELLMSSQNNLSPLVISWAHSKCESEAHEGRTLSG
jgi:hypothetical protein